MSQMQWTMRRIFNTLGYSVARKDDGAWDCEAMPNPSPEMVERAEGYFANSFPVSPDSGMSEAEVAGQAKGFFWHYPFRFGNTLIEADEIHFKGLRGRHYQRYLHIFPALLSLTGGSLEGRRVLDIACNCGFWALQARRAGAEYVLGTELSEGNVEQAKFILKVTGMEGIEYAVQNVYDLSPEATGEFDVTFFMGLLYHIDKPVEALERLYAVTREFAVIDTTLARSDVPANVPILKIEEDKVHEQNVSNRIALVPNRAAVPVLLRHAGFREVFWIPNATSNLPLDYLTQARMSFIAVK